jgi:tRNA 2-thiouridine synthesizing protein A
MSARHTSNPAVRWDAGETGCGQLIVELRRQLERLGAGAKLEVIARDAGAPIDLPAWCRMTGHRLVQQAHPVYVIERRRLISTPRNT